MGVLLFVFLFCGCLFVRLFVLWLSVCSSLCFVVVCLFVRLSVFSLPFSLLFPLSIDGTWASVAGTARRRTEASTLSLVITMPRRTTTRTPGVSLFKLRKVIGAPYVILKINKVFPYTINKSI